MIKKLKGTLKEPIQQISTNSNIAESEKSVANEIASTLSTNSSTDNYNNTFKKHKLSSEKQHLDFSSHIKEDYNQDFTLVELLDSINELSDTAPGPDEIHNTIIKKLPKESQLLLLSIYNNIWNTQSFPDAWHQATIIPIPKPGKDHSNPSNYRPIALTNCLCKLMEKLINKRLSWFLEKK